MAAAPISYAWGSPWGLILAPAVVIVAGTVELVLAVVEARQLESRMAGARAALLVQEVCRLLAVRVASATGLDVGSLVVSAWLADGSRISPIEQFSLRPAPDRIVEGWGRPKGIVGSSIADQRELIVDLSTLRAMSRGSFERLDPSSRVGLTWAEYATTKADGVWAIPLRDSAGGVAGAVVVEATAPESAYRLREAQSDHIVAGLLALTASLLQGFRAVQSRGAPKGRRRSDRDADTGKGQAPRPRNDRSKGGGKDPAGGAANAGPASQPAQPVVLSSTQPRDLPATEETRLFFETVAASPEILEAWKQLSKKK